MWSLREVLGSGMFPRYSSKQGEGSGHHFLKVERQLGAFMRGLMGERAEADYREEFEAPAGRKSGHVKCKGGCKSGSQEQI